MISFSSQRFIALFALLLVVFFNITFFSKLFTFAHSEANTFLLVSAPFILWLLFICIFNFLLVLFSGVSFRIILVFLLMSSTLSSYFIDTFGTILDKNMFANVLQTDLREIFDLLTFRLVSYIALSTILSYWILFKAPIHFNTYRKEFFKKLGVFFLTFALCVGFYMMLSKNYSSFFRNHNELKMYFNPYFPLTSLGKFTYMRLKPKPTFQTIATDAVKMPHEKKKLVIVIVGETARAQNFSLMGYDKNTNPLLSQRKDIVALQNVYSCGTATAISVPCMFSKFGHDNWNDSKEYYENVVDVLAKTGVRVLWRDNNSGGDKDVAKRVKDIKQLKGVDFDRVLFNDLENDIKTTYEDTLVVLHQEGSHGPTYFERYPSEFKRFTPTCDTQDLTKCSQEAIVNTYNNTIVYTDYIINRAIELLKSHETSYETSLIYMSDHGESLGENGIYLHGLPYLIAPDSQKHIPAIIYTESEKRQALQARAHETFSHDNLFHTLLGLFDVQTQEYNPKLDMLR